MGYRVSTDIQKITLMETDTVKSVLQNIAIIMSTVQHTVPLYRDFGLSSDYKDKPVVAVKPLLMSRIIDAITTYEPRATITNIEITEDVNNPGKLIAVVEVEINE